MRYENLHIQINVFRAFGDEKLKVLISLTILKLGYIGDPILNQGFVSGILRGEGIA